MDNKHIPDPELLDIVRNLRRYVATFDSIHVLVSTLVESDNVDYINSAKKLVDDIPDMNKRIAALLRVIEGSGQFKTMVKKYHVEE